MELSVSPQGLGRCFPSFPSHPQPRMTPQHVRDQPRQVEWQAQRSARAGQQLEPKPKPKPKAKPDSPSAPNGKATSKHKSKSQIKTTHSPSPFQRTLYLSNLPHTIKPSHFDYILSHPSIARGRRAEKGCKKDPGISMIQIYTLPYEPPRANPLTRLLRKALCLPSAWADEEISHSHIKSSDEKSSKEELLSSPSGASGPESSVTPPARPSPPAPRSSSPSQTPRGSNPVPESLAAPASSSSATLSGSPIDEAGAQGTGTASTSSTGRAGTTLSIVEAREVEVEDDLDGGADSPNSRADDLTRSDDSAVQKAVGALDVVERGDTIAWIHFRTEDHLYKAKSLLSSVSIDGRKLNIRCDRSNHGIIRGAYRSVCQRM
ncbi:hypothetical protein IAU59_007485 [Kwoniella sp. CBS 9459]